MQPRTRSAGTVRRGSARWWALAAVALVSVSAGAVMAMTIDPLDTVMITQLSVPSHSPRARSVGHTAAKVYVSVVISPPDVPESAIPAELPVELARNQLPLCYRDLTETDEFVLVNPGPPTHP